MTAPRSGKPRGAARFLRLPRASTVMIAIAAVGGVVMVVFFVVAAWLSITFAGGIGNVLPWPPRPQPDDRQVVAARDAAEPVVQDVLGLTIDRHLETALTGPVGLDFAGSFHNCRVGEHNWKTTPSTCGATSARPPS